MSQTLNTSNCHQLGKNITLNYYNYVLYFGGQIIQRVESTKYIVEMTHTCRPYL